VSGPPGFQRAMKIGGDPLLILEPFAEDFRQRERAASFSSRLGTS